MILSATIPIPTNRYTTVVVKERMAKTFRTWQPHKKKRLRTHGFLKRMASFDGRKVLKRRRAVGRAKLTV